MGLEVTYEGNFAQVMSWMDETAQKRMREAAMAVHRDVVEVTLAPSGPRGGKTYFVPGTNKTYTASAPGEAPASATGTLHKSVKWGVEGDGMSLIGFVGTDAKEGPWMEFGVRGGKTITPKKGRFLTWKHYIFGWLHKTSVVQGTILPRPWLRPTFERDEHKVQEIFRRPWE